MQKYALIILALLFSFSAMAGDNHEGASWMYTGTLVTGIVAPGAETTGVILKIKGGVKYELDFGNNIKLAKLADKLNGKQVVITGVLHTRQGMEVGVRHIIDVTALKKGGG